MSGRLFERLQREHDLWTRWEETRMAQETPDIWQADNALVQSAQRRHELALWAGWEETQAAQETPGVRWVDNIGHALIQSVTFTVGGEVLSDYHQEWLELWNMLGAFPLCQHCGGGRHYFFGNGVAVCTDCAAKYATESSCLYCHGFFKVWKDREASDLCCDPCIAAQTEFVRAALSELLPEPAIDAVTKAYSALHQALRDTQSALPDIK